MSKHKGGGQKRGKTAVRVNKNGGILDVTEKIEDLQSSLVMGQQHQSQSITEAK